MSQLPRENTSSRPNLDTVQPNPKDPKLKQSTFVTNSTVRTGDSVLFDFESKQSLEEITVK